MAAKSRKCGDVICGLSSSPSCEWGRYWDGMTPLMIAGNKNRMVELLLSHPKLDVNLARHSRQDCIGLDGQGATALSIASKRGSSEAVKLLLANNATLVNKADADGRTPFAVACENERKAVVEVLLSFPGTDVNKADAHGTTPLMKAASGRNRGVAVVQLLLRCPRIDFEMAALHWAKKVVAYDRLIEKIEYRSKLMKQGHTCPFNRFG